MDLQIGSHRLGEGHPTFFIADISANHDGDLERAKLLIRMAKEAGADAFTDNAFEGVKIVNEWIKDGGN